MALAIFDLDNTLIGGDSDYLWGEFLVEQGVVDGTQFKAMNEKFYQDYQAGELDMFAYLDFALAPLAATDPDRLLALRESFVASKIKPIWLTSAENLLYRHRQRNDHLLIITATNRFVVTPICQMLGVDDVIAVELEQINGRYSGRPTGILSYREGKVERLKQWLQENPEHSMDGCWFYSDSINDKPLLELVENPVAVDPDAALSQLAKERNWRCITLREENLSYA